MCSGRKGLVVALVVLAVMSQGCEQVKARYTDWWEGVWILDMEQSTTLTGNQTMGQLIEKKETSDGDAVQLLGGLAVFSAFMIVQLKDGQVVMPCTPLLGCGVSAEELLRPNPQLTGRTTPYKVVRLSERAQLDMTIGNQPMRLLLERGGDGVMWVTINKQRLRYLTPAAIKREVEKEKAAKAEKEQGQKEKKKQ